MKNRIISLTVSQNTGTRANPDKYMVSRRFVGSCPKRVPSVSRTSSVTVSQSVPPYKGDTAQGHGANQFILESLKTSNRIEVQP